MSVVKCGVTRERGAASSKGGFLKARQCSSSYRALRQALHSIYRLDDFDAEAIGAGFFSKIFKVSHKVTKQVLVLKMNVKEGNEMNVRREIDLMNRLSHPNVIKFYGVCISSGQMHALVEYINGGSLDQLLQNHSVHLAWTLRIQLACDVAKGLKYMHSNGFMHRDLTSKNILIKRYSDGRTAAVVADLGLANKIPSPALDTPICIVGSPYWMAPECILGKRYNQKADIFSYGIVLCEIIARVDADPEILPRTKTFGVDYVKFCSMASDCPLHFLHQAFVCCQIDPSKRPSFKKIVSSLQVLKSGAQMAVILADLNRLGIVNNGKNVLNRMLLEKILEEKLKQRQKTVVDEGAEAHRHHATWTSKHKSLFQPPTATVDHSLPQQATSNNTTAATTTTSTGVTTTTASTTTTTSTTLVITTSTTVAFTTATTTPATTATTSSATTATMVPLCSNNQVINSLLSSNMHKLMPVTPMIVGKVMSKDDIHYAPHLGNPFPAGLRRDKLVGRFSGCCGSSEQATEDSGGGKVSREAVSGLPHHHSILNDCSAFLELHNLKHHPHLPPHKSPPHLPTLIWPPLYPPECSLPSQPHPPFSFPVRLFRSNSLPATPTTFLPKQPHSRLNATLTNDTVSVAVAAATTEAESDHTEASCGSCGLGSYFKTLAISSNCCVRASNRSNYQAPLLKPTTASHSTTINNATTNNHATNDHTTEALNSHHTSITHQPLGIFQQHQHRTCLDHTSGSSSVDSALGREEGTTRRRCGIAAGGTSHKQRLRKIRSFCHNSQHNAFVKKRNIYKSVDGEKEEEEEEDDGGGGGVDYSSRKEFSAFDGKRIKGRLDQRLCVPGGLYNGKKKEEEDEGEEEEEQKELNVYDVINKSSPLESAHVFLNNKKNNNDQNNNNNKKMFDCFNTINVHQINKINKNKTFQNIHNNINNNNNNTNNPSINITTSNNHNKNTNNNNNNINNLNNEKSNSDNNKKTINNPSNNNNNNSNNPSNNNNINNSSNNNSHNPSNNNNINNSSNNINRTTKHAEFTRFHFRTSSALVSRSASAIYHRHCFTEDALLCTYLHEMLKSASNNKPRRWFGGGGGDDVLPRSRQVAQEKPRVVGDDEEEEEGGGVGYGGFGTNRGGGGGGGDVYDGASTSSDDEALHKKNDDYYDDDDDDDDDYFSSSLCNNHHSCCSPGSFYSLDDNPSSSSCADVSTAGSYPFEHRDSMPGRDPYLGQKSFLGQDPFLSRDSFLGQDSFLGRETFLGRDDPKRRSKEKFLELVKGWEGRSEGEGHRGCGHCSYHLPTVRPMEFAEFYLFRRFQELKQKWEQL